MDRTFAVRSHVFYYAAFRGRGLLAWRFHSNRILFSVIVLLLGHHAVQWFFPAGCRTWVVAFDAIALLIPLNFAFLTFFTERGDEGRTLLWFLALLFFESVFVAAAARPEQPVPGFLHFAFIHTYHSHLPPACDSDVLCLVVSSADSICTVSPCHRQWHVLVLSHGVARFHAGPTARPVSRTLAPLPWHWPVPSSRIRTPSLIRTN